MDELAVVCGATGPLGRAVVAELVSRGDRVVAVARSTDDLRALEKILPSGRDGAERQLNVHPDTAKQETRHRKHSTLLEYYTHSGSEVRRQAIDALDARFNP